MLESIKEEANKEIIEEEANQMKKQTIFTE